MKSSKIIRKWHNWKQYNKARKKPHPFVVSEGITAESVMEKCEQVRHIHLWLKFFGAWLGGLENWELKDLYSNYFHVLSWPSSFSCILKEGIPVTSSFCFFSSFAIVPREILNLPRCSRAAPSSPLTPASSRSGHTQGQNRTKAPAAKTRT